MSFQTIEVELLHGRVIPRSGETIPETGPALLTLLGTEQPPATFDPLKPHPLLSQVVFHEDPSLPLDEEDWPDA